MKPPIAVHQFPNDTTLGARRTIGPACRLAGRLIPFVRPGCRLAGRLVLFVRSGCRLAGRFVSRLAGRFVSRLAGRFGRLITGRALAGVSGGRWRGLIGLVTITPFPDLGSFRFGDEVIEEKAVLLLFEVEVVELNVE